MCIYIYIILYGIYSSRGSLNSFEIFATLSGKLPVEVCGENPERCAAVGKDQGWGPGMAKSTDQPIQYMLRKNG